MKKETKRKDSDGKKIKKQPSKRKLNNKEDELSEDDDAEYFKQELGEKPDKIIMTDRKKNIKSFKKRKYENSENNDSNVSNKEKIISFDKNNDKKKLKKSVFFRFSAKKKNFKSE